MATPRFDRRDEETNWGLYADEPERDLATRKSIKVKLPVRQHIQLHALKLFSDNNISRTVELALDLYFEKVRQEQLSAQAQALTQGLDGTAEDPADPAGRASAP